MGSIPTHSRYHVARSIPAPGLFCHYLTSTTNQYPSHQPGADGCANEVTFAIAVQTFKQTHTRNRPDWSADDESADACQDATSCLAQLTNPSGSIPANGLLPT